VSEREIKTAYEMAEEMVVMITEHLVRFRNEATSLVEAWGLEKFDDAKDHASNASAQLDFISCSFNVLVILKCIKDGSWPEEEAKDHPEA
jgi:hypothetical protein